MDSQLNVEQQPAEGGTIGITPGMRFKMMRKKKNRPHDQ